MSLPPSVSLLSRVIDVEPLGERPMIVDVIASADECAALAKQNDLLGVSDFRARLTLQRTLADHVTVSGTLGAQVEQTCVVSLEPFTARVETQIALDFADERLVHEAEALWSERGDDEEADEIGEPPDLIVHGRINVGAAVAEAFVLALDPYPRKPGVAFSAAQVGVDAEPESPFAVLGRLKAPPQGGS